MAGISSGADPLMLGVNVCTAGGDPALSARVAELVCRVELRADEFDAELAALEREYGTTVYTELLFLMAHLRFEPAEALCHWRGILDLRDSMEDRLGAPVDVRVALVSYFVHVSRKLQNPKVIEQVLFQETQASVYRDELTGLYNFRYFREYLASEIERIERCATVLSLVMIDIDDFKHYNDSNGHQTGNQALGMLAEILYGAIRTSDTAVRYGGEEFALILTGTSKEGALQVAERVRRRIEAHAFPRESSQPGGRLTASAGVATFPADAADADTLVRNADRAMYQAKSRGKNQVSLFGQDRRSYRRVVSDLHGCYCELSDDYHSFTTLDISEGGLLLLADRVVRTGSLLDVKLRMPGQDRKIACIGRVVRVEESVQGKFTAAMRIVDISQWDRLHLATFARKDLSPPT